MNSRVNVIVKICFFPSKFVRDERLPLVVEKARPPKQFAFEELVDLRDAVHARRVDELALRDVKALRRVERAHVRDARVKGPLLADELAQFYEQQHVVVRVALEVPPELGAQCPL